MAGRNPTRLSQSLTAVLAASGGVTPVATLPAGTVLPLEPTSLLPLGATEETDKDVEGEGTEGTGEPVTLVPPTPLDSSTPLDPSATTAPVEVPLPEKAPRKESTEDREKAAMDKEKVALEEAMTHFRSEWFRYAERQLGPEGAQDAMSEVWCRFWECRAEVSKPREWMYGCLRNVIRDMTDPARRQEIHLAHLDPAPPQEMPEAPRPDGVSLDRLIESANLSEMERTCLQLRREGVALRVIAKQLKISLDSADKLAERARAKLRSHLSAGNAMLSLREE